MKNNQLTPDTSVVQAWAGLMSLFLVVSCHDDARALEIAIVAPNEYENIEGSSGGSDLPGLSFRSLTIFPASEFTDVPESHRIIKSIAFRPNASVLEPRTSDWGNTQWFLSTTTRMADDMSNVFSENHGLDRTMVYNGPLMLTTQATGPPEGPRDFDYSFELQDTFFYDPTQGNLALEFVVPDGMTPSLLDDQATRPNAWLVDFPLSGATLGAFRGNQLIVELTFVPEPKTLLVLTFGLAVMLVFRWPWATRVV